MISSTEPLLPTIASLPATPVPGTAKSTATAGSNSNAAGSKPADGSHTAGSAELDNALKSLNDALQATPLEVRVSIDKATHRMVTSVVDKATGETIRQFPSKEVLRIVRAIDKLQGLLIHQTA
ncbi:flagellar protein FlaG [Cupriavidus basilensis]|uniref:Flagellar protein FlaG n=1 Tax=Cupriavidus basilensis TaxID=68895 RepID=A0ABT6ANB5_9BURK|nr:flagellar protein FlaG [Cupriavidus basilensis]MDF3834093.1 flagellar protein FlaG [Cupriavidus basilensis]